MVAVAAYSVSVLLCLFACALGEYVPVVLMHGMGDSCCSAGLNGIKEEIEQAYPGIFVHSIRIGATDAADRMASFFGSLNEQVDEVCTQLAGIEELRDGFDAVGFSQGGQILRAYVQRCNSPRVRNLITIGAQHQGVMDWPGCQPPDEADGADLALAQVIMPETVAGKCGWWQHWIKDKVYSEFAQKRVVQAQYFKDPFRFEEYLAKSGFLADINNEGPVKNEAYAANMRQLGHFVMFMFADDAQWFGYFDGERRLRLREQAIYQEDWIGLRTLDGRKALHFLTIDGEHMHLPVGFVQEQLAPWLGDGRSVKGE